MAGLLAWAADVVGGNAHANGENEERLRYIIPKFTPEEEDYVRQLDQIAASLQRSLQQLRQRLPPPNISQRLPHLHADSLASNSALALEQRAHSATRLQAQIREDSLQAENAAYAKAIAAGQQQIQEKSQEKYQLEARLKEVDEFERNLRTELEKLQTKLLEKENNGLGDESKSEGEHNSLASSSVVMVKAEELENKRKDLKLWEDKLIKLEEEWTILQYDLARQPSPAQREKELERRLRSSTEQLVSKQAQAEALANERNALEFRLEEVDEARRQLHLGNVDTNFKRNKTGRSGLSASSSANATYDESKMHSQILSTAVRPRAVKGAGESTSKITGAADLFSLRTGGQRRFMLLRSLIVLYILGLHLVVFIIISFSKLGR
eukprot:Gb_16528 [translate_table: standard]